jgi:hypothetical protein
MSDTEDLDDVSFVVLRHDSDDRRNNYIRIPPLHERIRRELAALDPAAFDEYDAEQKRKTAMTPTNALDHWKKVDKKIGCAIADDILRILWCGTSANQITYVPEKMDPLNMAPEIDFEGYKTLLRRLGADTEPLEKRTNTSIWAIISFPLWRINRIVDWIVEEIEEREWVVENLVMGDRTNENDEDEDAFDMTSCALVVKWSITMPEARAEEMD